MKHITTILGLIIIIALIILMVAQLRTSSRYENTKTSDEVGMSETPSEKKISAEIMRIGTRAEQVNMITPLAGQGITSPFILQATVPPGWVFEASTSAEIYALVDGQRIQIGQGILTSGEDWMSGNPFDIVGTVLFENTTTSQEGLIVLGARFGEGETEVYEEVAVPVILQ